MRQRARPWRVAMASALQGPAGCYPTAPAGAHFTTAPAEGPAFADAVLELARRVGARQLTDVGAGDGRLLAALHTRAPELRLTGVELRPRPADLPPAVGWLRRLPDRLTGLVVANEWLDTVPVDVVAAAEDGRLHQVLVDRAGRQRRGPPADPAQRAWLGRWWPLSEPGQRAEVGLARDRCWAALIARLTDGLAVAVDYGHLRARRPTGGTLTGYRGGRQVPPRPDGGCDITAHVAFDAAAAAGRAAGAAHTELVPQRTALARLGVVARWPRYDGDPAAYLAGLVAAGAAARLLDPAGYGGFWWLVQARGRVGRWT